MEVADQVQEGDIDLFVDGYVSFKKKKKKNTLFSNISFSPQF